MANKSEEGLDDRHRDDDGRISRKHGNTKVETLRQEYGDGFAEGYRKDAHLETVLEEEGAESLSELLRRKKG
jgi:hypothetical protein